MTLTEKQKTEKEIAEIFISLYNPLMGTNFEISQLGDAPDVACEDNSANTRLDLEIALLENLPGQIRHTLGRGEKPRSQTTGTTVVDLFNDVIPHFRKTLEKKMLSAYGAHTALVLYQVSILWEPREWQHIAERFRAEIFEGKEGNFGAGVWVICTDNSTWPASITLFPLSPPVDESGGQNTDFQMNMRVPDQPNRPSLQPLVTEAMKENDEFLYNNASGALDEVVGLIAATISRHSRSRKPRGRAKKG